MIGARREVDRASAPNEVAAGSDRLTMTVLTVILIGAILFNRFGIEIEPGDRMAVSLPITLAGLALLAACGRVELNVTRLILYMLTAATLVLVTTVNPTEFSLNSLLLVLVVYACFTFQLTPNQVDYRDVLNVFQNLAVVCSLAGILQFAGQFVVPGPHLFTFAHFVPEQFLMSGFNTVIPLQWDSPYYKSNGFFLLEPSIFSQIVAVAIVIELLFFERRWRLAVYAAGLLLAYSGTGLLLLVWMVPLIFLLRRRFWMVGMAVLVAVILIVFAEDLRIDLYATRVEEFGTVRSSGYARYVAPWLMLEEYLFRDPISVLFGKGPGTYIHHSRGIFAIWTGFEPHDPTWSKLLFEYGLIGFVVFIVFILYCFLAASPSRLLALALLFGYLTFGGMLLKLHYQAILLVLTILPVRGAVGMAGVSVPATGGEAGRARAGERA